LIAPGPGAGQRDPWAESKPQGGDPSGTSVR